MPLVTFIKMSSDLVDYNSLVLDLLTSDPPATPTPSHVIIEAMPFLKVSPLSRGMLEKIVICLFNGPDVAGAVLQSPPSLID